MIVTKKGKKMRENALEIYIASVIVGTSPDEDVCIALDEMTADDVRDKNLMDLFNAIKGGECRSKRLQAEIAFLCEISCHETILRYVQEKEGNNERN